MPIFWHRLGGSLASSITCLEMCFCDGIFHHFFTLPCGVFVFLSPSASFSSSSSSFLPPLITFSSSHHLLIVFSSSCSRVFIIISLCHHPPLISSSSLLIILSPCAALGPDQRRFAWQVQDLEHSHTSPQKSGDNLVTWTLAAFEWHVHHVEHGQKGSQKPGDD